MVSIILPVYNSKKFIRNAIDSILNQTYRDFELIIIDDGASDGTDEICKEYSKDNSIIRYIAQKNAGVCAARNRGIIEAKGEYISFCDHDDEYEPRYLEKLIRFCSENDLDMVKCGTKIIDVDKNDAIHNVHVETFSEEIVEKHQLIKDFLYLSTAYFDVWNGIYKTEFLLNSGVKFDESFVYGMEDYDFNTRIIPYVNKIGFMKDCLYIHYMRMNQSMSGRFKEERIFDIEKYQEITYNMLNNYSSILDKDWSAISFGKNLIGIIKYSVRGNIEKNTVLQYIRRYSEYFAQHIESIYTIDYRFVKYSFVALLAKQKKYNLIYLAWICQYRVRESILMITKRK